MKEENKLMKEGSKLSKEATKFAKKGSKLTREGSDPDEDTAGRITHAADIYTQVGVGKYPSLHHDLKIDDHFTLMLLHCAGDGADGGP